MKMNRLQFLCAAAAAVSLLTAGRASASVIQADYKTAGDGLAVLDTATGLKWLDATVTLGQSPNQAIAANPGFQFANLAQVTGLLEDAGIPAADVNAGVYYTADLPALGNLAQLLRLTDVWVQYYGPQASGWEYTGNGNVLSSTGNGWSQEVIDVRNPPLGGTGAYTQFLGFSNCLDCSSSANFNFLVSATAVSTTPEPATLAIAPAALLGLGLLRRRRIADVRG